jgi:hypothetical protein
MPLVKKLEYEGCTIVISDMVDGYLKNIFDDSDNKQLPDVPYSPLGAGVEGAIDDAKRSVDDWKAKKNPA